MEKGGERLREAVTGLIRRRYEETGRVPSVREVCKLLGISSATFYRLFPRGRMREACRLAGVPVPEQRLRRTRKALKARKERLRRHVEEEAEERLRVPRLTQRQAEAVYGIAHLEGGIEPSVVINRLIRHYFDRKNVGISLEDERLIFDLLDDAMRREWEPKTFLKELERLAKLGVSKLRPKQFRYVVEVLEGLNSQAGWSVEESVKRILRTHQYLVERERAFKELEEERKVKLDKIDMEIKEREEMTKRLDDEINELKERLQVLESDIEALEEQKAAYERELEGVRRLIDEEGRKLEAVYLGCLMLKLLTEGVVTPEEARGLANLLVRWTEPSLVGTPVGPILALDESVLGEVRRRLILALVERSNEFRMLFEGETRKVAEKIMEELHRREDEKMRRIEALQRETEEKARLIDEAFRRVGKAVDLFFKDPNRLTPTQREVLAKIVEATMRRREGKEA